MKYLIWLSVLFGDIFVAGLALYLLIVEPRTLLSVGLAVALWLTWFTAFGFGTLNAWRPSFVKQYLHNANKLGL
jgi:hypothetical protein